ncbi:MULTISPECIES: MBL fold metallo-hydrolase [Myroides]|uniref:MBL fold metallo-hydrolase n=1 Tax=Myroides TaxID=76831 RepID=UPI0025787869|nr:MBL fold metallo-hydrolase [Myroides odoratimimus]MDM1037287.1 MBL fold metallo-hydrolase [Myroides odoratimimus]MDM1051365.1 MBL fold metallo-hydrolase [Myroides odoratimimus]
MNNLKKRGRVIQKQRIKVYEIADNVFAAISPYRGISWANAGFINRGKGLVYDTFFDLFHAQEMKEAYTEISNNKTPAYVVNSHYNSDHTWGNKVFEDSCIIMHHNAVQERLTENIQWMDAVIKRGKDSLESTIGERFFAAEFEGFDLTGVEWINPDIQITDDTVINLGNTELQLLNVAPSHSNSDVLLWMPKEKVLFAGDVVFNGCSAYSEKGILNWVKVLDRIINEIKPEIVVPGHGAICGVDFVQEQYSYLMNILETIDKHYTEDIDALTMSKLIDITPFTHWIQPERIYASVDAILKGKRNQSAIPNWNEIPEKLKLMQAYQKEKYGDSLINWNPKSTWECEYYEI